MRLTGGEARGRPLRGPRGRGIRPTSDRVRKALFDILGERVRAGLFLDAYAGTGAVGIDALSRGSRGVVFVERDRDALALIRHNLGLITGSGSSEIIEGDVERALGRLRRRAERFSTIFLDPPYDQSDLEAILAAASRLLDPGGILILEHRSSIRLDAPPGTLLRRLRTYRHGDTSLTSFLPGAGPA